MEAMALTLPHIYIGSESYINTRGSLAEGWELAVLGCWDNGVEISTQYDKPGDPKSRDASLHLIFDPRAEPHFHRCFPGGIDELEMYRAEVLPGVRNHWIDPEAGKWQYTYNERMTKLTVPGLELPIDQFEYVRKALVEAPHTRRAQIVIWKAWEDAGIHDPACLQ